MTATVLKPLALSIISDSICPFCFVGYRKIQLAIDAAKRENLPLDFKLQFQPFQLDPTLSDQPRDKNQVYIKKFGAERSAAIQEQMKARGKEVGIDFSYGGVMRQTIDSHRLIDKAFKVGGEPMQRAVVEALFSGYFEKEQDIGSVEFLADCAITAGVMQSKEKAVEFVKGTELKSDVMAAIRDAQMMGVSGVPYTIINQRYAVSGAQEPAAFLDLFRKIAREEPIATVAGETC